MEEGVVLTSHTSGHLGSSGSGSGWWDGSTQKKSAPDGTIGPRGLPLGEGGGQNGAFTTEQLQQREGVAYTRDVLKKRRPVRSQQPFKAIVVSDTDVNKKLFLRVKKGAYLIAAMAFSRLAWQVRAEMAAMTFCGSSSGTISNCKRVQGSHDDNANRLQANAGLTELCFFSVRHFYEVLLGRLLGQYNPSLMQNNNTFYLYSTFHHTVMISNCFTRQQ